MKQVFVNLRLIILGFCAICLLGSGLRVFFQDYSARQTPVAHPSGGYDPGDQQGFHAPLARLIYTRQTRPTRDYTVIGVPGCAPPNSKIIRLCPDGTEEVVADVGPDGWFALEIPYDKGKSQSGLSIRAMNQKGLSSSSTQVRTDRPLMGGLWSDMNERGWVNITFVSVDEQDDMLAWKNYRAESLLRKNRLEQWAKSHGKPSDLMRAIAPDSLQSDLLDPWWALCKQTTPQDVKVYGYAPAGEMVTCILPANGSSFTELVRADRTFSVVIPNKDVAAGGEGMFSCIVNITDQQNRLFASTSFGLEPPQWADMSRPKRAMARIEAEETQLIGQIAPDFTLERVDGKGAVSLRSLRGQVVLINVWAIWCDGCRRELPTIEKLYPEMQKEEIALLSINVGEPVEHVRSFLEEKRYTFPVLSDAKGTVDELYKIRRIPAMIAIDRAGVIRFVRTGRVSEKAFRTALRENDAG